MQYLLIVVGIVIGVIIASIYYNSKSSYGILNVAEDDTDGLCLFLELSKNDLSEIASKKEVTLRVKRVSQK